MLALARKYRPRNFASVAVQTHVSTTLKGAIERGRVAHGYLLCGPRGVGKTTLARVLAMALNCERRADRTDGEPCGECTSCTRIWAGSTSLDVVEIDAASNRGVDDARELRERAMYAPSGDNRYKVYIVDEAHMLTREAWNALLKVLEEPPPRVVFVFATTEPQKIAQMAAPVLSRLQRFDFKRIGPAEVRERLTSILAAEKIQSAPDALALLARAADGSMRDALSLTDQVLALGDGAVTVERVRQALGLVAEDEYLEMLDLIGGHRAADVFPAVRRLADLGVDFGGYLAGLADMLRAQLTATLGGTPADVSDGARATIEERRAVFTPPDLLRMLSAITEIEPRFKRSSQQQLLLETLLVRFALLDRSVDLESLLREMGGGAAGGSGAALANRDRPGPPPRSPRTSGQRASPRETTAPSASNTPTVSSTQSGSHASTAPSPGLSAATSEEGPRRSNVTPPAATRAVAPLRAPEEQSDRAVPLEKTPLADRVTAESGAPGKLTLDLHRVVERWDEIVQKLAGGGRTSLAGVLRGAMPVAVTARGEITIELDEPNEIATRAFESGRADLLAALATVFSGVERVALRLPIAAPPPRGTRRETEASARAERVASLRRKDPLLGAAIDALDLDLIE